MESGRPSEDAWSVARAQNSAPVLSVCLCDGMGSASRGGLGAQVVSKAVSRWIARAFGRIYTAQEDQVVAQAAALVEQRIGRWTNRLGGEMSDYATTLVAIGVQSEHRWLAINVGDGAIAAREGERLRLVCGPQTGEFANATFSATSLATHGQYTLARGTLESTTTGFVLFTDGVQRVLLDPRRAAIAPAVGKMLAWMDRYESSDVSTRLAHAAQLIASRTRDDLTVALLAPARPHPISDK